MSYYGYARISRKTQNIERQIHNLKYFYPDIIIHQEAYTGTTQDRPEWVKLKKKLRKGDTLVFDSVSRMSRNAAEGVRDYFLLKEQGINLVFLKERHIDTDSYDKATKDTLAVPNSSSGDKNTSNLIQNIFDALATFQKAKATTDIERAFEQAQKEVDDLRQRTREGIREAKAREKTVGRKPRTVVKTEKEKDTIPKIIKMAKKFEGNMKDKEVIDILKINRKTYYKYCHTIKIP